MKDWNGKDVATAKSKGGVLVLAHPLDNLISTGCLPWPPPEVVQKLYQSRQVRAFGEDQLKIFRRFGLGYYSDLQSIHSEDAITWSVFGTVARAERSERENWLADLFQLLRLPEASPDHADIFLWRRIPHPDTLVPGGPEIDVGIITSNALVLGEAKWKSRVNATQGREKDKDQIQLRVEFLQKYGHRLFPRIPLHAVVGVSLLPDAFAKTVPEGVTFRSVTWESICSLPSHPHAAELQRYFEWKRRLMMPKHNRIESGEK
ncbi:hypothetical protein E3J62_09505 [candidate division TA06 bacterium]|uniref:Uncharacterized protein n=1 Tax=candidate division TA06 bacterium TaxID=2250710 RepID=A0A523UQM3_UNCT6|nr:MAG: hypothetical protein E3J62_09505 [candidate division TA06 bacterium]